MARELLNQNLRWWIPLKVFYSEESEVVVPQNVRQPDNDISGMSVYASLYEI